METLVGYASEEGENSPLTKREKEEETSKTQHAPQGKLAAEWEAFECLLGGSAFAPGFLNDLPRPVAAPSCSGVQPPTCFGVQPPSCSGVQPPTCTGVQPPSSHKVYAPEETSDMSIDEESASQSSSGESDSSSGDSKKGCEQRRQRIASKGSLRSRASRSSDSDSSCSPSRATTVDVDGETKQRLSQVNCSASDDTDSERHASSSDSSDSSRASPKTLCATYKSSDSDTSSDKDSNQKDVAVAASKSHTVDERQSAAASTDLVDVTEDHGAPHKDGESASPSHEVSLRDRLLKIADEHCSKGDVSKADKVRRDRDVSSSRSPSPHKRREVKRRYRRRGSRSRSKSREKGRRRGGHNRRSRSRERSRRDRKSRSGSHHRRSRSGSRKRRSGSRKRRSGSRKRRSGSRKRNRTVSTSSVTKSSAKERKDSTTGNGKETSKSERKKSHSRSRSRHRRSRSRGRRSRSRGHRSRSRGHRSKSRHSRSRSRDRRSRSHGRRSRSRDRRNKKRGRRVRRRSPSPARGHAFEGFNRGGWKKKKERPLERGRNCMIRYPSPQPSAHKKRLEKLLKHTAPPEKRLSFKESLLLQLAKMQKDANAGNLTFDPSAMEALESGSEKPSNLPLNSNHPLLAMMMATGDQSGRDKVTPQQAMIQTMAAMHQKAQELTGVSVPKYYNPAAVNPLKYAEQMQKRKLLWSKVKADHKEEGAATWGGTAFSQDQDGKIANKFRKLMGVKEGEEDQPINEQQQQKQQELFDQLDRDYEFARMTTHTHRGIGLGFQSLGLPDLPPDLPNPPNPQ